MARILVAALVELLLSAGTAAAQCSSMPYTFTNGTTADASQVNANFSYVLTCANNQASPAILRGWIAGLTMSNDTTNPNTVIDTSAGVANSDDLTTMMTLAAFTKSTSGWTVGTGNGCIDTGTVQQNTWYHLFVIARTDTGVVDQLCSTNATGPTMPTNYTKKRRIGSFKTAAGSTNIVAFSQKGDEFLWAILPLGEVQVSNLSTTPTLYTVNVPTGVKVNALLRGSAANSTANSVTVTSPDEASGGGNSPNGNVTVSIPSGISNSIAYGASVRVNTSAQIRAVSTGASTYFNATAYGWVDTRGRFD